MSLVLVFGIIFQLSDDDCRLEEALVRFFVLQVCKNLPDYELHQLLNPNEVRNISVFHKQLKWRD
jgi:hypothetical protein